MSYTQSRVIGVQGNSRYNILLKGKLLGNISDDHDLVQALLNMSNQRLERTHYASSLIKINGKSPLLVSGNEASHWPKYILQIYKRKEKLF